MIDQADLDRLKDLRAKAATGQVNVAVLNQSTLQLQTTKPALAIGFFRNRANADYAAAAWTWLPKLIAELEDRTDEAEVTMKSFNMMAEATGTTGSPEHRSFLKPARRRPRVRKRAPTE